MVGALLTNAPLPFPVIRKIQTNDQFLVDLYNREKTRIPDSEGKALVYECCTFPRDGFVTCCRCNTKYPSRYDICGNCMNAMTQKGNTELLRAKRRTTDGIVLNVVQRTYPPLSPSEQSRGGHPHALLSCRPWSRPNSVCCIYDVRNKGVEPLKYSAPLWACRSRAQMPHRWWQLPRQRWYLRVFERLALAHHDLFVWNLQTCGGLDIFGTH